MQEPRMQIKSWKLKDIVHRLMLIIFQLDHSNPENRYTVSRTGKGLICECPDHQSRKSDCKHIKVVLDIIRKNLPAYKKSSKKVFGKKTNHIRHIHIAGKRDREKVFRGLKRMDTPLIDGMKTYYNFTKKHGGLNDKTLAQSSLIDVDGKNKWIVLIQNASLYKQNLE